GFETVTIVYQGEVAHRDSTGAGGVIGPGDVQWMTAGAGILHEEFHSPACSLQGGTMARVRLWVNLPRRNKVAAPGCQSIASCRIPGVGLPEAAGPRRVIAGEFGGAQGAARTFTPMAVLALRLAQGAAVELPTREGFTLAL